THRERIVTTQELRAAVWPEITVSAGVLKNCIWEIRQALCERAKSPRFIATVPRRGYRFIAPVTTAAPVSGSRFQRSGSQGGTSQQRGTWNLKLFLWAERRSWHNSASGWRRPWEETARLSL